MMFRGTTRGMLMMAFISLSILSSHPVMGGISYEGEIVNQVPSIFRMVSLTHDIGVQQVVATFEIQGGHEVVPVIYVPTVGMGDEPEDDNSLLIVTNNPCAGALQDKLCCLRNMTGKYDMDVEWGAMLASSMMESCDNANITPNSLDNTALYANNNEMFHSTLENSTVLQGGLDNAIPGVEYSYSHDGFMGTVTMRMSMLYLEPRSKLTQVGLGTYRHEFFIGVVFATLRAGTSDIFTTVVQQNIEFIKSDYGFFAVGSEQDRSIIKQVRTEMHQAADPAAGAIMLQFMRMNLDYSSTYDNVKLRKTGLRYMKSSTQPTNTDVGWVYPCADASSIGTTQIADWTALFAENCLANTPSYCEDTITDGVFWVPFDTTESTDTEGYIKETDGDTGDNFFFSFEVEFVVDNRLLVETVFGTVDLSDFPVLTFCKDNFVLDYQSIGDTVAVSVKLGLSDASGGGRRLLAAGDPADSTDIRLTTTGNADQIINKLSTPAASYGDAVISMVFDGLAFSADYAVKFSIDNLLIYNFLGADNAGYEYLMAQVQAGTGFSIVKEMDTDTNIRDTHFTITPTFDTASAGAMLGCNEYSTVDINTQVSCLWRRAIVANAVTADASQSIYFKDTASSLVDSAAQAWVKQAFFNKDYTNVDTDAFLASRCSKAYADDGNGGSLHGPEKDGSYGCMFIDPGYRWSSQGRNVIQNPNMISDKTVVIGVVTLQDMDYDAGGGRRLLSMNADGSNMRLSHLSHDGADKTRLFLNKGVAVRTAIRSRPTAVSRAAMQRKLKADYIKRTRHETGTKLKVLGNHALTRHLLSDEEGTDIEKLKNESASQVFVVENEGVVASVNIATVLGYSESEWTQFSVDLKKPDGISREQWQHNVNMHLKHSAMHMGEGIEYGGTTGFVYKSHAASAHGRGLLQVTESDGYSVTVNVAGILKMSQTLGKLYTHMFKCILGMAAAQPLNLTLTGYDPIAGACINGDVNASAAITDVQNALVTSCGTGTDALPAAQCHKLYEVLSLATAGVAFDWYAAKDQLPTLFFGLRTSSEVDPMKKFEYILKMRTEVSKILGVEMDKVYIEIRDYEVLGLHLVTSRRLLDNSHKTAFYVWVYAQTATTLVDAWPGTTAAVVAVSYKDTWRAPIKAKFDAMFEEVEIDTTAVTTVPFTIMPFAPILKQFSIVIPVDVTSDEDELTKVQLHYISHIVAAEFAAKLNVPIGDIRTLGVSKLTKAKMYRYSIEVRLASEIRMDAVATIASDKASNMTATMEGRADMAALIEKMTIRRNDISKVVDSYVQNPKSDDDGLSTGVIIGIIIACLVVVGAIGWFVYQHEWNSKAVVAPVVVPDAVARQDSMGVVMGGPSDGFDGRSAALYHPMAARTRYVYP